jgi:hypothetical protein
VNDGWHNLAVKVLLRAVDDTGRCQVAPCPKECRARGPWCDLGRFWRSDWARLLCAEAGVDYRHVERLLDTVVL